MSPRITLFLFLMIITACTGRGPAPTASATVNASPTLDYWLTYPPTVTVVTTTSTPSPSPSATLISTMSSTVTSTPTVTPNPTCTPLSPGTLYFMSDGYFIGSLSNEGVKQFEAALEQAYPEWAALQIRYGGRDWTIGSFFQVISGPGSWAAASPEVMVVTLGVKYDWQVPERISLADEFISASIRLTKEYADFLKRPEIRRQYPQVGNAATYALYRYFKEDVQKLQEWHAAYVWIFGYDPRWGTSTVFPRPGQCEREPAFPLP